MTATELLKCENTDNMVYVAFRGWLKDGQPTKRKAREFLHNFGDKYGVREVSKIPKLVKPVVKVAPQKN